MKGDKMEGLKKMLTGTGIVSSLVIGLSAVSINFYSACATAESLNKGYNRNQIEKSEMIMGLEKMEVGGNFAKTISAPGRYIVYGLDSIGLVEHGHRAKEGTTIKVGGGFSGMGY